MSRPALQQAAYALLQAQGGRRALHRVALLETGPVWLTCVVRLPATHAAPLHEAVRELPGAGAQYVYPVTDLHLTLLNLRSIEGPDRTRHLDAVTAILSRTEPFSVELRGLGMSDESVYGKGFVGSGALVALRRRLAAATGETPPWPLRRLCFVNVLRYRQPDLGSLPAGVRGLRHQPFGTFTVDVAEIVRTDKVLSQAGTTVVVRAPLTGRRQPGRL